MNRPNAAAEIRSLNLRSVVQEVVKDLRCFLGFAYVRRGREDERGRLRCENDLGKAQKELEDRVLASGDAGPAIPERQGKAEEQEGLAAASGIEVLRIETAALLSCSSNFDSYS